jgi:hypothetical protein
MNGSPMPRSGISFGRDFLASLSGYVFEARPDVWAPTEMFVFRGIRSQP